MRISRKVNVTSGLKKSMEDDTGKYRPIVLTFIPGKVMGQIIPEVTFRCVKQKKVIRSSQHRFTKKESCLTILIAFCDGTTG